MDIHDAAAASLLLAAVLANLPFCVRTLRTGWRLAALAVLYAAWIGLSLALEARAAAPHAMTWQAWFVSAALFGVLAFPGVSWRYLWRRGA